MTVTKKELGTDKSGDPTETQGPKDSNNLILLDRLYLVILRERDASTVSCVLNTRNLVTSHETAERN